jgi:hypothetical protein
MLTFKPTGPHAVHADAIGTALLTVLLYSTTSSACTGCYYLHRLLELVLVLVRVLVRVLVPNPQGHTTSVLPPPHHGLS